MPAFDGTLPKTNGGAGNNPQLCTDYVRTGQGAYRNIFYVGDTISFPLYGGLFSDQNSYHAPGTPNAWEIRHGITGVVVASGGALSTVTDGMTWTPLSGGSPLNLPCGPYVVAFTRAASIATWGVDQGGGMFVVVRNTAGFPARPGVAESTNFSQDDIPLHGVLGMGSTRLRCNPNAQTDFPGLDTDVPALASYVGLDTARPAPLLMGFAEYDGSGTHNTNVAAAVTRYSPTVTRYEGHNEPNSSLTPSAGATNQQAFYTAVKGANASAVVVGPNPVTIGGHATLGVPWLTSFGTAGGYAYCDELSFHLYNSTLGDLLLARRSWDGLVASLTASGVAGKPRWVTEIGYFGASNGSYTPHKQAIQIGLDLMLGEQYGVPKERYIYYYDQFAGNSFVSHALNLGRQPHAAIAMYRCYSEELAGATYESRLDFGTVENDWMIGSTFRRANGTGTAVLMSCGLPGHTVKLQLAGGTLPATVTLIDSFGNSSSLAVSAGIVTVAVASSLPMYVRLPAGITATVIASAYWADSAYRQTATSASGLGGEFRVLDNTTRHVYYFDADQTDANFNTDVTNCTWQGRDVSSTTEDLTATFTYAQTFDTVVIYQPFPVHRLSSFLDFDVQTLDSNGTTWTTQATVTKTPTVLSRVSTGYDRGNSFTESFHDEQHVFKVAIPTTTSRAVRLHIRSTTAGGEVSKTAVEAGGGSGIGWDALYPTVMKLRVYRNDLAINPRYLKP